MIQALFIHPKHRNNQELATLHATFTSVLATLLATFPLKLATLLQQQDRKSLKSSMGGLAQSPHAQPAIPPSLQQAALEAGTNMQPEHGSFQQSLVGFSLQPFGNRLLPNLAKNRGVSQPATNLQNLRRLGGIRAILVSTRNNEESADQFAYCCQNTFYHLMGALG